MIEALVGNTTMEKVLFYLERYEEGYAQQIADTFSVPLNLVQRQLKKLEAGGILVSRLQGKTRVYRWNPRFALRKELRALLQSAFDYIPPEEQRLYFKSRTRPRRAGKPL